MKPVSILLHVQDVSEASSWYQKVFRSAILVKPARSQHQILTLKNITIEIVQADSKVQSGTAGSVVYWEVGSVAEEIERLEQLGASVYRGPMQIEEQEFMCQFKDPFGNLFGIRGLS